MLIYALDATHFTANFGAKRGAEIAPPPHAIVVDTLRLDAPHHHGLVERVAGAFTLGEPQHCRWIYAMALFEDDGATLDDLHEAVTTLEGAEQTARRVLGGAHPTKGGIEAALQDARAALRARETPSPPGSA